jgi:hypothetical protein
MCDVAASPVVFRARQGRQGAAAKPARLEPEVWRLSAEDAPGKFRDMNRDTKRDTNRDNRDTTLAIRIPARPLHRLTRCRTEAGT